MKKKRFTSVIIVAVTAAIAAMFSLASGDGGQLTQGGLTRVAHGSAFTGSGTTAAPLNFASVNCGGSAVSAIDAFANPTCISAGGGSIAVFADSPLAGSGSSGSHLTWSPTLDSSIAGTGSSGNSLKVALSVNSPMAGTGSSGSSLTWSPTLGSQITGTGSAGSPLYTGNDYKQTHYEYVTDFCAVISSSGGVDGAFTYNNIGGGATSAGVSGVTRPCIAQWATGTTNATGNVNFGTSVTAIDFGSYTDQIVEWTGGPEALITSADTTTLFVGFGDIANSANALTDGCGFWYDQQNVASGGVNSGNVNAWECMCSNNSTRTAYLINGTGNSDASFPLGTCAVGAVTLPNTNIHRLKVVVTGSSESDFYCDNTKVCEITSNIPSGASRVTGVQLHLNKTVSTTSVNFDNDQLRWAFDLTGARSP